MTPHPSPLTHGPSSGLRSPWWAAAVLLLIWLLLLAVGWWRGTGVGPQVQVPMFYDDHYLYPRPWTQAQEAPGVPPPAPVAFYGPNHISQAFVSAAGRLGMIGVWLDGPAGTPVEVSLAGEDGLVYRGQVALAGGRVYHLTFPPIDAAQGQRFRLTLAAPTATAEHPVVTRTVGGDRLGGPLWLNEYRRPGNLELYTYSRGLPGRWWLAAVAEQVLPVVFRLRLQQYKPVGFKGAMFPALLAVTATLSTLFLLLAQAHPRSQGSIRRTVGWGLAGLLFVFLVWQAGSGRVYVPLLGQRIRLQPANEPLPLVAFAGEPPRLVNDWAQSLWTTERRPEERFISTAVTGGLPALHVPAVSSVGQALTLPLNGRLRTGVAVEGDGELRFLVRWGEQVVAEQVTGSTGITWLDVDLSAWGGQAGSLSLATEPAVDRPDRTGELAGLWVMPQLLTTADWLLPDPLPADTAVHPVAFRFDETAELVAYALDPPRPQGGEPVTLTLYWRILAPTDRYATVFVHLLDEADEIQAQHDAQPVANSYPLPNWQPGTIIADAHPLLLPPDLPVEPYRLAVGLYDPVTFGRWSVSDGASVPQPGDRAILPMPLSVEFAP